MAVCARVQGGVVGWEFREGSRLEAVSRSSELREPLIQEASEASSVASWMNENLHRHNLSAGFTVGSNMIVNA